MFLPLAFQRDAEWKFISISNGEAAPRVPAAPRGLTNPARAGFQCESFVRLPCCATQSPQSVGDSVNQCECGHSPLTSRMDAAFPSQFFFKR